MKRNKDTQVEPDQKRGKQKQGAKDENEPKRKKQLDKGIKEREEREAKRRKKEEQKKRDAKQQQRKEPNFSIVEEASNSYDEYQPTVLDESTSSESEGEEQLSIATKHPSKGCARPLQQSLAQLTCSPAASSGMPNPGCTPLNTSTKPGHKHSSTVVNAQPRQLPSTSLGNSSPPASPDNLSSSDMIHHRPSPPARVFSLSSSNQ